MAYSGRKQVRKQVRVWGHLWSARQDGRSWGAGDVLASLRPHLWIFALGLVGSAGVAGVAAWKLAPATRATADVVRLSETAGDPATMVLSPAQLAQAVDAVGVGRLYPALADAPSGRAQAIAALARGLHATAGDNGALLSISFRHPDPMVAGAVMAALVQGLPTAAQVAALPVPVAHQQRIDNLRVRRADAVADQARLQSQADDTSVRLTALAGQISAAEVPPAPDPDLAAARSQLNDLELKRVLLAGKYADGSPMLEAADDQIKQMRALLADEIARQPAVPDLAKPLKAEVVRLTAVMASVQAQQQAQSALIASLDQNITSEAAAADRDAAAIPRPAFMRRSLFTARDPDWRWLAVPGSFLLGLALSAAATWFAFTRRRVLCTALEVEACLGLPVMMFDQRLAAAEELPLLARERRASELIAHGQV